MKPFSLIASLFGGFSLLTVLALAQSPPSVREPPPAPSTGAPAEARAYDDTSATDTARFKSLDTDGDERISRAEFALGSPLLLPGDTGAARETHPDEDRKSTDKNTATRFSGGSNSFERFNQLDTNKDSFLSHDELAAPPGQGVKG